jgi:hypothetical protein
LPFNGNAGATRLVVQESLGMVNSILWVVGLVVVIWIVLSFLGVI